MSGGRQPSRGKISFSCRSTSGGKVFHIARARKSYPVPLCPSLFSRYTNSPLPQPRSAYLMRFPGHLSSHSTRRYAAMPMSSYTYFRGSVLSVHDLIRESAYFSFSLLYITLYCCTFTRASERSPSMSRLCLLHLLRRGRTVSSRKGTPDAKLVFVQGYCSLPIWI